MSKSLIGLMTAWNAEDFIEPCIKQAIEYCDEVIVCISPHSEAMKAFEDKTEEIALAYRNKVNILRLVTKIGDKSFHSSTKAGILNNMLTKSKLFEVGNWIFILDVDEFFPHATIENAKILIENDICDQIGFDELYFYINMQSCLLGNHNRLFKIKEKNMDEKFRFFPTQFWNGSEKLVNIPITHGGMFHYGMLTNPWAKKVFWETEYPGGKQGTKTLWLDKIYRNYDLQNQEYWVEENRNLFGIRSPWFADNFTPDENGILFRFEGKHPWAIEDTGLEKIEDFRKRYNYE